MTHPDLPIPSHFNPDKVSNVWRVPYQQRAEEAGQWAKQHHIPPAASDRVRICLLPVDVQNTFCIPGFELYGDNKKQVLSETILPEEILTLLQGDTKALRKQRLAIAIDEISNFMNHHNWWNKINDIMYAISAQRRKLGVAMLMTGPLYYKLPPDMRDMIHEIVHCQDNHVLNHSLPRGLQCLYHKEDRRGLLSNPRHPFSKRKIFMMKPWYKHYDTFAAVDALNQFIKIKFKGREVTVGADGKILSSGFENEFNPSKFDDIVQRYQVKEDPQVSKVRQVITFLKNKGIEQVGNEVLCAMIHIPHTMGRNGIGSILKSFGARYDLKKKIYILEGIDT